MSRPRSIVTGIVALCVVLSAPASLGAGRTGSAIQRAIGFLFTHQVRQPGEVVVDGDRDGSSTFRETGLNTSICRGRRRSACAT